LTFASKRADGYISRTFHQLLVSAKVVPRRLLFYLPNVHSYYGGQSKCRKHVCPCPGKRNKGSASLRHAKARVGCIVRICGREMRNGPLQAYADHPAAGQCGAVTSSYEYFVDHSSARPDSPALEIVRERLWLARCLCAHPKGARKALAIPTPLGRCTQNCFLSSVEGSSACLKFEQTNEEQCIIMIIGGENRACRRYLPHAVRAWSYHSPLRLCPS
jgi:hypothetical protein